jgi:hypothetical protein
MGAKSPDQIVPKLERRQLYEVIGELGGSEDRKPTERKGIEEPQRWSKDCNVVLIKEERLPNVDTVRQDSYMRDKARVEYATNIGGGVTNAPEEKERDRNTADCQADRKVPIVLESRAQAV